MFCPGNISNVHRADQKRHRADLNSLYDGENALQFRVCMGKFPYIHEIHTSWHAVLRLQQCMHIQD